MERKNISIKLLERLVVKRRITDFVKLLSNEELYYILNNIPRKDIKGVRYELFEVVCNEIEYRMNEMGIEVDRPYVYSIDKVSSNLK